MRSLTILTAALALSACSNDKSTTITTDDGKEVKITANGDNTSESGTITFEGKDGEAGKIAFGDEAAKQGLPLGMPVYPGAEVKGAFSGDDTKGKGEMATVITGDTADKVIAYYKEEVIKRGMTINSESTSASSEGKMRTFAAEGADGRNLVISATSREGGTTTAMIMGGSKN